MLSWRLLGINFCIQPSFWLMNALWACLLFGPASGRRDTDIRTTLKLLISFDSEIWLFILIWVLCTLVSVMVHELGHVITGRIFGQPGNITVTGLGGQAVGEYGALRAWQRILVIAAGPGAGFAFVALIVAFDPHYWNGIIIWLDWPQWLKLNLFWIDHIDPLLRMGASPTYDLVLQLLFFINLFVNIMNLLPIIPMDGGMIFKEFCVLISPKGGLKFAFIWSFVLALGVTVYMLLAVLKEYGYVPPTTPVYYPFQFPIISLLVFGMMALQSWRAYQQIAAMERHELFSQRDE
ncbi:MAG: hypothetical protein EXR98_11360 [Gemmataceae bacterium]|nr:hypothetical protein [Gemmataceae bacterium]